MPHMYNLEILFQSSWSLSFSLYLGPLFSIKPFIHPSLILFSFFQTTEKRERYLFISLLGSRAEISMSGLKKICQLKEKIVKNVREWQVISPSCLL